MSWSRRKGKKYNWLDIHALFYMCNKLAAFNVHHRFRDYHKLLLFQSSNSRLFTVPYFFLGASGSSAYRYGRPSVFSYVPQARQPGTFEIKVTIHNTSARSQWSYGKIVYYLNSETQIKHLIWKTFGNTSYFLGTYVKHYCHIKKIISLSWYLQCTCFINDIWHQCNVHQTSSVFGSHDGCSHPVLVWIQGNFCLGIT